MKGKTKTKFGKTKFTIERLCFEVFLTIFAGKEINDIFDCSYFDVLFIYMIHIYASIK